MTNKQYLVKSLSGLNISEDDIDIVLMKSNLDGEAEADVRGCDEATYRRMSLILKGATQNVSESGYSISWNMDAVKAYYSALCTELGLDNVLFSRPKIRNKSNVW